MSGMIGFLGAGYPWVMALHVIFVIFLMAGLFMMPRFFVYHQESPPGSEEEARWVEREDKLRKIILNPAIILVWVFGIMLALNIGAFSQGWFHAKLLLVLILSAYHGWIIGYLKKLKRGERPMTGKKLRLLNEVPGLIAIVVVILVFVKPF